jgi:tetratricopeptide (TPR) repeat protein
MSRNPTRLAALLVLALPALAAAQLIEDYRFKGKLLDTAGKPLADVKVTLRNVKSGYRIVFETNDAGEFDRRMIPHAVYEATFEKPGYVTQRTQYDWSATEPDTIVKEAQVVLESEDEHKRLEEEKAKAELGKKAADLYRQAYDALTAGDCDRARKSADELLAIGAGSFEYAVRFVIARCLASAGQNEAAAAEYAKVLELKGDLFEAQFDVAGVYEALGRHEAALQAYRRAAEIKPEDAETQYKIGAILYNQSRFDEALPHLEGAVQLNASHAQAAKALGFAYLAATNKDMKQALAMLKKYLELEPQAGDREQIEKIVKELE